MKNKILKNDRIFVAGSNGMVGNAVRNELINSGYGNIENGGHLLTPSREQLDLSNNHDVNEWFAENKPSIVILAAAKVGGIFANSQKPVDFILENLKIQNNVIENSWRSGVKRLLFLGSSCIYPKYSSQPIEEEELLKGELEETNEWYAIAKIAGLKLCESLRIQYGFDAISLMPTNLYGTGDNYHPAYSHVMPALIKKFADAKFLKQDTVTCWGSGSPRRELMHVNDLAKAVIFVLENFYPGSKDSPVDSKERKLTYLNVGTGTDISIKELAELIAEIIDYDGKILWDKSKPDGTPVKLLNITRISQMGWKAEIDLKEGIKKTIKEYKNLSNYL